jgi:hypothetical protein
MFPRKPKSHGYIRRKPNHPELNFGEIWSHSRQTKAPDPSPNIAEHFPKLF